ncbi:hypothetical protein EDD11_009742 [Mortierella claussenii]|nr:hypothetical protein EDD11_009742 [Mortierella claussenii]
MTAPFDQYEKVDIYIVDDGNKSRSYLLQGEVDLNIGMMAARLEAPLFPEDLPVNRSCHILLTRVGNALDGTHQTLNSSSFFMIRNKQTINGTLVPISLPLPTATTILTTTTLTTTNTRTTTTTTTTTTFTATSASSFDAAYPTNISTPPEKASATALSPLVIGLISAGCVVLLIAIAAIGLLLRTRRRFKGGNTGNFTSLYDQPGSPTDDASKNSIFKEGGGESFVGPAMGAALTTGRSSSNTIRSVEPMMKGAPGMLGYNNSQDPPSPTTQLPLVERKPSTLYRVPESAAEASAAADATRVPVVEPSETLSAEGLSRKNNGSALTVNDAQLIAETFRKSMRRPRWDDDEDEQDEARRAANELLRKELSEQGLDVQRGVQRRVTIQDRPHRSSIPPPISQTISIPEP